MDKSFFLAFMCLVVVFFLTKQHFWCFQNAYFKLFSYASKLLLIL